MVLTGYKDVSEDDIAYGRSRRTVRPASTAVILISEPLLIRHPGGHKPRKPMTGKGGKKK